MTVSNLTTGRGAMVDVIKTTFSAEGYTFLPLAESLRHYFVRFLNGLTGGSYSTKNTSPNRVLALIASDLTGTTISELTRSEAELLAIIANIGGGSPTPTSHIELEDASGSILLEDGSGYIILES